MKVNVGYAHVGQQITAEPSPHADEYLLGHALPR